MIVETELHDGVREIDVLCQKNDVTKSAVYVTDSYCSTRHNDRYSTEGKQKAGTSSGFLGKLPIEASLRHLREKTDSGGSLGFWVENYFGSKHSVGSL